MLKIQELGSVELYWIYRHLLMEPNSVELEFSGTEVLNGGTQIRGT